MKRIKILLSIFAVAAMSVAGYTTYDNMTMSDTEKLMLANVEALAITTEQKEGPNWIDLAVVCCKTDLSGCLWAVEPDGGSNCTPDKCSKCGKSAGYATSI